jgi:hypothetical protein
MLKISSFLPLNLPMVPFRSQITGGRIDFALPAPIAIYARSRFFEGSP